METIHPAPPFAAIILAAGASSRMGRPKPALPFRGEPLVRRTARTALDAGCAPVFVILGAHADACRAALAGLAVTPVLHEKWSAGLGTSLRAGLDAVRAAAPDAPGVFALLCDQPLIDADLLNAMAETLHRTERPVVACGYRETVGAPALFRRDFLPRLADVTGDAGARSILKRHADAVAVVPFPPAATDVDTPDDYHRLLRLGDESS
jgi:molybdenum cofactor cytidylyltransferase